MKQLFFAFALLASLSSFAKADVVTGNNEKRNAAQQVQEWFNAKGEKIGTSQRMDYDKLPQDAIQSISKSYPFPTYKLTDCQVLTNEYGEQYYYVALMAGKNKTVLEIDQEGALWVVKK
ncbi:MAG: hypothetical protein EAZ62_01765 [Sphingobacteriia bacterium]|jgi:hypothetical protein|nr:MAG: hypothetical protein EAZ62_01765 [Sphingobacteriia bacterium]